MKLTGAGARRFSEKPDLAVGAALLHGPNRGLIAQASAAIIRAATGGEKDPFAVTRLTDDDLKADRAALMDALCAQSLLGDARLVRVRLDGDAASASVVEGLRALEGGQAGHFLLVEAYGTASGSALVKAFEGSARAVSIAFYEDAAGDLDAYAADQFKALKTEVSPEALRALRDAASSDRALLRQEIEKLALYAHGLGRPLSAADVDALIGDSASAAMDAAARHAMDGAGALAAEALGSMETIGAISALKVLERRLLRMAEARSFADGGMGPLAAVKALKPPVFWKDQDVMAEQLGRWTRAGLSRALDLVWRCEIACKRAGVPQDLLVAHCYREVAEAMG